VGAAILKGRPKSEAGQNQWSALADAAPARPVAGFLPGSAIQDAIENDPETEVKMRAVFALSQLRKDEGVPLLT
jgi:hypothetical protein